MRSKKKFGTLKNGKHHIFTGKWNISSDEWDQLLKNKQVEIYNESELFYLSEKILEWYYNDELGIVIIHGQQGYGKSTYGLVSGAEVYGHNEKAKTFYYDWDTVKEYTVFTPRQFLKLSRKQYQKAPLVIWDDAGYWLNALDYYDPLVKAVGKFMEVARSKWGAIVFTCSDQKQILSKIRNIPHAYTIKIIKGATPNKYNPEHKWKQDRRLAKVHKSWVSEDLKKTGRKTKNYDVFYAHMPNYFYRWYKPFRDSFCDQGLDDIENTLDRLGF